MRYKQMTVQSGDKESSVRENSRDTVKTCRSGFEAAAVQQLLLRAPRNPNPESRIPAPVRFPTKLALCLVACGLCLAAINGCMVGPDYKPPTTPMPAKWYGPTSQPTSRPAPETNLVNWWKTFKDPEPHQPRRAGRRGQPRHQAGPEPNPPGPRPARHQPVAALADA